MPPLPGGHHHQLQRRSPRWIIRNRCTHSRKRHPMTPFIAHCLIPDGRKLDAIIMSDVGLEETRDAFTATLQDEFPGALVVAFHPADVEDGPEQPTPEVREPRAIESMVMYGWAAMVSILFIMQWLNNRKND